MGAEQTKHISRRHTEQCGTNGGTSAETNCATIYRLDGRSSDACVNPSYILAIGVVVRLAPKAFCAPAGGDVGGGGVFKKAVLSDTSHIVALSRRESSCLPMPPPVLSAIGSSKNQLFLVLRGELLPSTHLSTIMKYPPLDARIS